MKRRRKLSRGIVGIFAESISFRLTGELRWWNENVVQTNWRP